MQAGSPRDGSVVLKAGIAASRFTRDNIFGKRCVSIDDYSIGRIRTLIERDIWLLSIREAVVAGAC